MSSLLDIATYKVGCIGLRSIPITLAAISVGIRQSKTRVLPVIGDVHRLYAYQQSFGL
jgi:hypothetical protein